MIEPALHPVPPPRVVVLAQLRAVALALRTPAVVAATLILVATAVMMTGLLDASQPVAFHPEHQMLPGMVGLVLPIFVWMGEDRFGPGLLWSLPVDRRGHALTKVFAGWVWLMIGVLLFVIWQLAISWSSGAEIFADERLRIVGAAGIEDVSRTPEPLLWIVPFTAATGTYLLASALALGTRHPLRWIAGVVIAVFLMVSIGVEWQVNALTRFLQWGFAGPYGVDALLTARTESLKTEAILATGETVVVWRGLPTVADWAIATLLWTTAGCLALWAAASRHRENRANRF